MVFNSKVIHLSLAYASKVSACGNAHPASSRRRRRGCISTSPRKSPNLPVRRAMAAITESGARVKIQLGVQVRLGGFRPFGDRDTMAGMRAKRPFRDGFGETGQISPSLPFLISPGTEGMPPETCIQLIVIR